MLAAVEAAHIQDEPFPHILVTDFFPADTYSRLLDYLPPSSDYEPFAYEKHANADGQSNRKRFRLENACLETLPHAHRFPVLLRQNFFMRQSATASNPILTHEEKW